VVTISLPFCRAGRTVIVSGVPDQASFKSLLKKARSASKVELSEYPVANTTDTAHFLFHSVDAALEALVKLEKLEFGGKKVSAKLFSTAVRTLPIGYGFILMFFCI